MAEVFYTEVFETWDGSEGGKGAGDDNQWQFYDVSNNHNIPPSAVLEVSLANEAFSSNYNIGLRSTASSGQGDDFRRIRLNEAENGNTNVVMHVQLDSSGYLQYFIEQFDMVHFDILGYWQSCDYVDRFDDITPVLTDSWRPRNLISYGVGSGQPVEILLTNSGTNTDHLLGAKNPFTDPDIVNRKFNIKEAEGEVSGLQCLSVIVPTSGADNPTIYAWTSDSNEAKIYLLGYFSTPPGDYTESYVIFPRPGSQSTWTELDVGASGIPSSTVGQFCIANDVFDNIFVGVRQTDSIINDRLLELDRQDNDLVAPSWGGTHGNIDANGKLEYYCDNISYNPFYYVIGYWDNFAESSIPFPYSGTLDLFVAGRNPYVHYIEDFSSIFNTSPIDTWNEYDVRDAGIPSCSEGEIVVAEILIRNTSTDVSYSGGVRSVDSTSERRFPMNDAEDGGADFLSLLVPVSSDCKISIYAGHATFIDFQIIGYWKGAVYTDVHTDFQSDTNNTWIDYDLGSNYQDKVAEIVITNNAGGLPRYETGGVRAVGNSDHRVHVMAKGETGENHATMHVNASGANGTIQIYSSSSGRVVFAVAGYWDFPPGTYNEIFTDINTTDNGWQTIDAGISGGSVAEIVLEQRYHTSERIMGAREVGSTLDRFWNIRETDLSVPDVAADPVRVFTNISSGTHIDLYHEAWTQAHDFIIIGYWDDLNRIPLTISASGDLFVRGHVDIETSGDLFIGGQDTTSDSIDLYIGEKNTTESSGNLYIYGSESVIASGNLFIHGYEISSGSFDLYTCGHITISGSKDLFIAGRNPYIHYIEDFSSSFNSSPIDTWNEYNVNNVGVPSSTDETPIVAEVLILNSNTTISYSGGVRSIDSTSERRFPMNDAEGGGTDLLSLLVPVSNEGKISIYAEHSSSIYFQIIGYWNGAVYTDVHMPFQADTDDAWINYNLGPNYKNKVVEIVVTNLFFLGIGYESGGVRAVGSFNHRVHEIAKGETGENHVTMHVNTSGENGTIQIYSSASGRVYFTLVGCWDFPPGTYNETFADINTIGNGWQTIDAGISGGSVVEIVLEQRVNTFERIMGAREVGSTLDRFWNIRETDLSAAGLAANMVRAFTNISSGTHIDLYHDLWTQYHNFIIIGHWDNFNEIPFVASDSVDLFVYGYSDIEASGDLFIYGHDNYAASDDLFVEGHISQSISGNLFIYGYDSLTTSGDLFIQGHEPSFASGNLFISGKDTSSGVVDLFIFGNEVFQESGDLYVNGYDDIFASGDLFIIGPVLTSGSNDLYMYSHLDISGSKNLFVEGFLELSGPATPSLFIHGHTIAIGSGDLFVSGSGIIPYSGNIDLIINGYEPKPALVCPILDPTASIQISDTLITIYQERIDALINQLGKNIYLEFNPIRKPCPNCEFDMMRKRSTGIYIPGGPRPFARGRRCPYCKGRGFTETAVNKCIKCLIKWNPEDAEDFGISIAKSNDIARLKTYLTKADDLVRANTAILNHDIVDQMKMRARMVQSPIPVGLREDRYCISFWELI